MSVPRKRTIWILALLFFVIAGAAVVAAVLPGHPKARVKGVPEAQARADEREESGPKTAVKAIHPVSDPSLRVTVRQLLSVKPFFETDLRPQVAGVVSRVPKSIGARVKKGDLLVEIAVPDLDQEVFQKAAIIQQRLKDVAVAQAAVANAEAWVEVTRELIEERRAEASEAIETREFRKIRSERFDLAVKEKGIQQNMADEEKRNYHAASFAVSAANSAVRKAQADFKEKQSLLVAARADVELKQSLVEVARRDYARAQAQANYARITAPHDGVVVARHVDAGTFVQNASTAQTEPMLTLARSDIVTVVMKVPDNYSPYVTRNTEAVLQFDDFPGVVMQGLVTRFSPSIRNLDRTMEVQVDLWNDTPRKYHKFEAKCLSTWLGPLVATCPLELAPMLASGDQVWSRHSKDRSDPFPVLPVVTGRTNDEPVRILPGGSGYMRLNLQTFKGAYLLPSSAVFSRGGKPYILEVVDGKSHMVPVRIQVNDGRLAKVAVVEEEGNPSRGKAEKLRELDGTETIILDRQVEIGDGQPVEVNLQE